MFKKYAAIFAVAAAVCLGGVFAAKPMVCVVSNSGSIIDYKIVDRSQYSDVGADLVFATGNMYAGTRCVSYSGKNPQGYDLYFLAW